MQKLRAYSLFIACALELQSFNTEIRDGRFGSKVGQIGPKWDKSGAFSDEIFGAFGTNLTQFGGHMRNLGLLRIYNY